MERNDLIKEIIDIEWEMFTVLKNTGGPAECQNNKPEFIVMRKGQWDNLPINILQSYLIDLKKAEEIGRNLLEEKYIRMMEFSAPEEFEGVKDLLPVLSPGVEVLIKKIEKTYLAWGDEFEAKFPKFSKLCRPLRSEGDQPERASVQTYLRGELCSYSLKTILFYSDYIEDCVKKGINLIYETHSEVVKMKGFESIEAVENSLVI
ncbi:DUF4125 family protein [Streptobacillus felis]|uniref:DUF4125 family protein n=1 Tax=Streptobacillus felis TaxID=1384509 RepID=A0A7Z0T6T7_9FUSO|nr:DUF4125 family protein [Streptobacillus felis]NYV27576.1 DUF4125 family protein [Streptobacillus felis]